MTLATFKSSILIYIFKQFIWLYQVLVAACGLSCSMQDLVRWPGMEQRPLALGAQSLNPWTTSEVSLFTS